MSTSACLVTSTPEFQEPERTRPVLVAATAEPSTRNVVVIDDATSPVAIEFKARVALAETDDTPVDYALYLDYGKVNELRPDQPFTAVFNDVDPIDPQVLRDEPLTATWIPKSPDYGYGCHTITLIAAHAFDRPTGCPVCRNDSSQLTWQIYRCDSSGKAGAPPCAPIDMTQCQGWNKTCPDAIDKADGGAASVCGDAP